MEWMCIVGVSPPAWGHCMWTRFLSDPWDLQDVLEMTVAHPHIPCVYVRNGVLQEIITTVEHALNLCQMKNNSSMQKLAEVIQYFHDIDRSDILELQIIYSS